MLEAQHVMEQRTVEQRLVAVLTPAGENETSKAKPAGRWRGAIRQQLGTAALVCSDALLALLVWEAEYLLEGFLAPTVVPHGIAIAGVLPIIAAWIGLRALLGLYPGYGLDPVEELRRHAYSVFMAAGIVTVFVAASQYEYSSSLLALVACGMVVLILAPLARHVVKHAIRRAGLWGKPIIVVSTRELGKHFTGLLRQSWELGYNPAAVFDYRLIMAEKADENPFDGEDTLSRVSNLAGERGINTIIFALPYTRREQVAALVDWASVTFRHVMLVPNLTGVTNSAVVARDLAGTFGVEIKHNLLDPWAQRTKRALDLFGAVVGGLLISPLMLALMLLIKLDSPGPAFFGHHRLGAGNDHFRCWKFRTMRPDADEVLQEHLRDNPGLRAEWEQNHKLRDDPRVTRVGRILRKTSLDELPQLWNVLKGEMSLIGPRPIVDAEVWKYGKTYNLYQRVRPGMSGFWQVNGRSNTGYAERVEMDSHYVRNWSVWLDVVLLARTVRCVLFSRGAY